MAIKKSNKTSNRAINSLLGDSVPLTKSEQSEIAKKLFNELIESGEKSPIDVMIKIKSIMEVLSQFNEMVKGPVISELDRYPKEDRKFSGVSVDTRDTVSLKYEKCAILDELTAEVSRIKNLMKAAVANGLDEIADNKTGELIPAAREERSETVVISFPK